MEEDENDGKSTDEGGRIVIPVESGDRCHYPNGPAPDWIQFEPPFHSHCLCGETVYVSEMDA